VFLHHPLSDEEECKEPSDLPGDNKSVFGNEHDNISASVSLF
jgi:hypothetical protein